MPMYQPVRAALLAAVTLALAQPLLAQQPATSSLPTTPQPAFSEIPVFSAAAGSTYLQTDLNGTNGSSAAYVLGWYGIPQMHFTRHLSVLGDFTGFYNYHAHTEENVRGFTGGPVYP